MNLDTQYQDVFPALGLMNDAVEYTLDTWQRMILFTDVIREQGTNFIEENDKGLPPVIDFDYQVIFDGRDLDRPVNYALARIMPEEGVDIPADRRPVIIIDPRAGHGPGIGAFKKESAVGIAMKNRHPVYFMIFYQYPVPDQTLADVAEAEVQFIEVVGRFHPEAEKPAVIGNCQAGWAAALLAADRPDITGPLFLNGSPLSYWAGKDVRNPMRYKGGLFGGTWSASMCADLGNGNFDGANLVKGFEDLNPANTLWKKNYNVYTNVDTEADRFLHFEKWWNGFFLLSSKEIRFITQDLFVGNKLETGSIQFRNDQLVDLKNLKDPIIVFASDGDNITPPQQALNWVMRVWGSVENIKRTGQVIIYLLHKDIGHLGIFVSSKVVKKEHDQMIGTVDIIGYLTPGLYEMVIDEEKLNEDGTMGVRFEARDFDNILQMDDDKGEEEFHYVSLVSEINESLYQMYLGPLIRMVSSEFSAEVLRRIHPLRRTRYMYSDLNPFLIPVKSYAPFVRKNRVEISENNVFREYEKNGAEIIATLLDLYRDTRDMWHYHMFYMIYGSPAMKYFFGSSSEVEVPDLSHFDRRLKKFRKHAMKGGMAEGLVRGLVALGSVRKMNDKRQLTFVKELVDHSRHLVSLDKNNVKDLIKEQAKILKADFDHAVNAIPGLIKKPEDRLVATEIFGLSLADDHTVEPEEKELYERLVESLHDRKTLY